MDIGKISKSKIDRAGLALAKPASFSGEEFVDLEIVFDEYRKSHLKPLSETTLELQQWLASYGGSYYIAQRLKRKPQIVRKLNRLSVRLTQLQDIGGCRIIVDRNSDVDKLFLYIKEKIGQQSNIDILRVADYREMGRDDSGYRALHIIMKRGGKSIELQIRSKVQHYWAESIERTSVIYGYHLKEQEGDRAVILYFKYLSNIFFEVEAGREPSALHKLELDKLRVQSEELIKKSDRNKVFDSYVNEDIIKTMVEKEARNPTGLNNWLIVFDWNAGAFVSWDIVGRNPDDAIRSYVEYENMFLASSGYEVVMIGSSDVATVRQTHSHYFGVDTYDNILESLDQSLIGMSKRMNIDVGARQILVCLHRKRYWGKRAVSIETLKNHFCKEVITFDSSLKALVDKGLVVMPGAQSPVSLNIKMRSEIDQYL